MISVSYLHEQGTVDGHSGKPPDVQVAEDSSCRELLQVGKQEMFHKSTETRINSNTFLMVGIK